ncbi:MAG: DUF4136 domain-containing protein [Prosthecochloris sp.]|uniref:DUF4136 domain-containing protein n=1 Tax=Prosthecochloris sp. TaxID=290513 RepID=UPI0013C77DBF|nr:DUF4136 domain-containing protein [Prosthecochloris sp.]MCW8798484.1 DUF4136 domain-containing protein [Prosthecochloris sp.]NEX11822.1 DUF4136 domain-containing protein [Prosthecochloris sp.]
MNKVYSMVSFLLLLVLASCSSVSVVSDYDRVFDFSRFQTYRWPIAGEGIRQGDLLVQNPLVYKRVQSAVDRELQQKGFHRSSSESADFILHVHAGVKQVKSYQPHYGVAFPLRGGWYRPWWGAYGGFTSVSYYEEGTLVVDIIDAGTKDMVWRGMAKRIVRQYGSPEAMQKDIDDAVRRVLAEFPPLRQ